MISKIKPGLIEVAHHVLLHFLNFRANARRRVAPKDVFRIVLCFSSFAVTAMKTNLRELLD